MKIVVTRPLPGNALELLKDHTVEVHDFGEGAVTDGQLVDIGKDADAMITLLSDPVSDRVMGACPNLKVIAQFAVGFDNIDVAAARRRGIVVTNTPGVLTDSTADFAFSLLLAAARHVVAADRFVRDGKFVRWETDVLLGMDLDGKTIGIVGLGRIGTAMARRAIGFGMRVVYHNRSRANPTIERVLSAKPVTMSKLLKTSDVVSLHCSLNARSHHLIDAKALERMKSTAILVNTARGAVVDEDALVAALRKGDIAAAGLDVFEDEPAIHSGLLELENVVLAPHIASATLETRTKMGYMCAEAIMAVFNGEKKVPYRVA